MARNDVYLYTNATSVANAVITSQTVTTAADFPDLVLGDTPTFNFYFTNGTASWPSFAGNAQYSVEWALGTTSADDSAVLAYQTQATAITGGWSIILPLNTGMILNMLNNARVSQEYPVVRVWQQIRVTDQDGYKTTYATIRTNLRLRTVPSGDVLPNDPLPAGYQVVKADADGALAAPSNFFQKVASVRAPTGTDLTLQGGDSGASVVLGDAANGNIIITPTTDGGAGHEFIQVESVFSGTQTANLYGIRARNTLAHAGTTENITWANAALLGEINVENTNQHSYSNRQHGLYGYVNHQGAGQLGLPIGAWAVVASRGAGGMGTARAFDAYLFAENIYGTGAVTSMTGFHCRSVTTDGATIGTVYGLYVDSQTAGGTNWGVYTAGTTPSYFGGNVTIGGSIVACSTENTNCEFGADARASNLSFRINTAAGYNRVFSWHSGGTIRWAQTITSTAESGGNAGSDYRLECYADNGALIGLPFSISRATMAATFGGTVTLPGGLITYGANDSGGVGKRLLLVPNA